MFFPGRYFFTSFYRSDFFNKLLRSEYETDCRRIERRLAVTRIFLTAACVLTTFLDSAEGPYPHAGRIWLLLYLGYGLAVWIALRAQPRWRAQFGLAIHALDLLLVSAFTVFTRGPDNAFHVLFLFVLLSAAYRWSFRETIATALYAGVLTLVVSAFSGSQLHLALWHSRASLVPIFLKPATYLLIQGLVAGFLVEEVKKLHAESSAIAHVLGGIHAGAGLTPTLAYVCNEALRIFGARRVLIAVQENETRSLYLWQAVESSPTGCTVELTELETDQAEDYFFAAPELSWCGVRAHGAFAFLSLADEGERVKKEGIQLPGSFLASHPCNALLADTQVGPDFKVRVFLTDPAPETCGLSGLFLLHNLFTRVTPTILDVYVARKARSAAAATERASLAREVHDGILQSLIAVEMRLAVLRERSFDSNSLLSDKLGQIQELLRNEIMNLRALMQRLKHLEFGSRECVQALESVAMQHQSECGMPTLFESSLSSVSLPPRACGEVVRILQEALVNIRKHSDAKEVRIAFGENGQGYLLTIRDDGTGFDFSGRLTLAELDSLGIGPKVLKERVRLVGGGLELESDPGHGSCLDIMIPRKRHEYRQI